MGKHSAKLTTGDKQIFELENVQWGESPTYVYMRLQQHPDQAPQQYEYAYLTLREAKRLAAALNRLAVPHG